MSNGQKNPVEVQQLQQQSNSMPSSEDLLQQMQLLEKRVKSLEVMNKRTLGLLMVTLVTAIIVGVGFGIAASSIIVGSIVGGIVAIAVFGAVAYKYKSGFKYAAEKTVEGAKDLYGKTKELGGKAKDSLERGASFVGKKVNKGTSSVANTIADVFHKASGKEDYLDKIKRFTSSELEKSDKIRNDMKEIFADKGNNAGLVENILSGISSKIDSKIAEEIKSGWIEHTSDWQVQKAFINHLNEKSLHSLLTQRSLPKGSYFIDNVFSEHYDEIKEIIKEYKENHLYSSVNNMFNTAEKKANRPSLKSLTGSMSSSLSSLRRKGSTQLTGSISENSLLDADSIKIEQLPSTTFGQPEAVKTGARVKVA